MSPIPVFDPVSPQALATAHLIIAIFIIGGGVFLLVSVWTILNIVRFRYRPGQPEPYQEYGRRGLEIGWTVAPALLLVVIYIFTIIGMYDAAPAGGGHPAGIAPALASLAGAADDPPRPDLVITGEQWWWQIRYTGTGVVTANEIYLPVGQRLLVQLESADVIHSLWLPQLGPKVDLVPGQTNYMYLEADKPGTYIGQCAEYCGTGHAWMRIMAVAVPPAQFAAWERQQSQPAVAPTSTTQAGATYFQQHTCVNCHTIAGTPAKEDIGPDLTHFASRRWIGAGVLDNTEQNLEAWLYDPQAIKPGVHMPNFHLTHDQAAMLATYLESLK